MQLLVVLRSKPSSRAFTGFRGGNLSTGKDKEHTKAQEMRLSVDPASRRTETESSVSHLQFGWYMKPSSGLWCTQISDKRHDLGL